ncbi:hypothetical protein BC940DRAFT_295660 [Gongronella butleri]|nr:hypothetical protein BC940DRAFT_295660 [Gongronella butleri]
MKDGFKRFTIEPAMDTLEFMGPGHAPESVILLQGNIHLSLTRPIKIKGMAVKFKGFGRVSIAGNPSAGLYSPILPKLKCSLASKSLLPAGDHVIPWDMEIPNIYPPSTLIKRANVFYRVEATISFALAKAITAEHHVVLRRHLLPCVELAPLVETKLLEHTVPAKFHYEIEAPQIICLDQQQLPFAVKYLCIANQKAVQSIRTQLTQIEIYKINSISKTESNLTQVPMDVYNLDKKVNDLKQRRDYAKYIKRTIPALIHAVDDNRTSAWQQPIVLRHKLHQYLHATYDSPLVSVHHQLEITFQFGHRFEDIKAKIPIIIASVPGAASMQDASFPWQSLPSSLKYPFETITRYESTMVYPESDAHDVDGAEPALRPSEDSTARHGITSLVVDTSIPVPKLNLAATKPLNARHAKGTPSSSSSQHPYPSSHQQQSSQVPIYHSPLPHPPPSTTNTAPAAPTKWFNSAMNLSEYQPISLQQQAHHPSMHQQTRQPYQRPHTSAALRTPPNTMQQQQQRNHQQSSKKAPRRRRPLPPIDVELANGIKPKIMINTLVKSNSSSEVLPEADRSIVQSQPGDEYEEEEDEHDEMEDDDDDDDDEFDFQSVYSDLSMHSHELAPGLSTSASEGSNGSHHSLASRPPSPANRPPGPGLPSNTVLRSHEEEPQALVEESFAYTTITSPAIATLASSMLLSPCNSNSSTASSGTRRRIALSSVSSLMNQTVAGTSVGRDSLSFHSFGGPFSPPRPQSGISVIPPMPSPLRGSVLIRDEDSVDPGNDIPPTDAQFVDNDDGGGSTTLNVLMDHDKENRQAAVATAAKQRYLHAKLPPIPSTDPQPQQQLAQQQQQEQQQAQNDQTATTTPIPRRRAKNEISVLTQTKRMTRLYIDDSDDETLDPLPPIPESLQANIVASSANHDSSQPPAWSALVSPSSGAPQLPRLSFGMTLTDAFLDEYQ